MDFEEREIVFISSHASGVADEINATAITGDPVNDAVFERNKTVEKRLNIKITSVHAGDPTAQVINSISSGSDDYDVMVARAWKAAPKTIDGYFANLRNTPYIDFDKPWWTQSFNEVMEYEGMQFAVTGAIVLSTYRRTHTTTFNKKIFTDANQPFLYEYVENGTWTLGKQASLVPLLHKDNGNSIQDWTGDVYGFVSDSFISVDPYWASNEIDIVKKNADGRYELVIDSGKMHEAVEKILHLYYNTNGGTYCIPDADSGQSKTGEMFANGYAAMATLCISVLESELIRSMPDEFGVVPIPKYDTNQTAYHSQMHDAFTIVCVPTTVVDEELDEVSAVLEAMASASYNIVRPVYYETTLRTKIVQDPQSSAMMEMIIDSIHIDAGVVFSHNMNAIHKLFQVIIKTGKNNTVSLCRSSSKSAQHRLSDLLNKLDKLAAKN